MNSLKRQDSKKYIFKVLILCFITSAVAIVPFIINGRGLFTLVLDFNSQQLPFNIGANESIKQGAVLWDWYADLGTSFVGAYSFYNLGSPFFWISLLFPSEAFPYVIGPMLILKYCVAGLTSYAFLSRFVKQKDYAVLGALLYAFSGFQTGSLMFNHFHDVVAFFPLMLLGLEMLVSDKKYGIFALSVALNAVVNYFFFVGEVVFLILYFCFRWLIPEFKTHYKKIPVCLLEGALGLGISAVLFLPSILATLSNPKFGQALTLPGAFTYVSYRYVNLLKALFLPADLMCDTHDYSTCFVYLPFVGIALALIYIINNKKSWLTRLLAALAVIALVPGLNSMFYAGNVSYYARWFYMPILMLSLATVIVLDKQQYKNINLGFLLPLAGTLGMVILYYTVYGEKQSSRTRVIFGENYTSFFIYVVIAAVGIITAYALVRLRKRIKRFSHVMMSLVMLFAVITMTVNIYTASKNICRMCRRRRMILRLTGVMW
ncbi:MAG TPA: hypothetical protein DEQ02_08495 [Ruminococcaceae bacterium]|nr:hypothetical protein [Oscillospiraceae bacterium]